MRLLPRHWWERLTRAFVEQRLPQQLTRLIDVRVSPELQSLLPWMIGEVDRGSAEDIAEAGRELSRFDARGWLSAIDVPTGVIITRRDKLAPVDNQRDLASSLRPAEVTELDVDHDAMITSEQQFIPALTSAVRTVARSASVPTARPKVTSGTPNS